MDLLAVQGTLKSLLQHRSLKASILRCSAFFMVPLTFVHDYRKHCSFDQTDLNWKRASSGQLKAGLKQKPVLPQQDVVLLQTTLGRELHQLLSGAHHLPP